MNEVNDNMKWMNENMKWYEEGGIEKWRILMGWNWGIWGNSEKNPNIISTTIARRAGSDGSMSGSGSAGPEFDPRRGSKFSLENLQPRS